MKKRILSIVLCLCMVAAMIPSLVIPAMAYSTGDTYPSEYKNAAADSVIDYWNFYNRECTSYVAWCLNDRNGVDFTNWYGGIRWGHAKDWGTAARSLGITVDMTPAVGAVAWWNSGTYGHVAWVSAVNGDSVTIEEYNYNYSYAWYTRTISRTSVSGYIHIKDISTPQPTNPASIQNSEQVCNLGDFYGRIGYNGGWLHTTGAPIPDGDGKGMDVRITTKSDLSDPSQVWQFIRQSNGSYKIVNMGSGWCLDVQTGTVKDKQNVWTWSIDHGDVPERWYFVAASGKSGYRLVSAIDNRFCMDIPGGDVHEGANAEIYTRNNNAWQFFTITEISNYNPNQPSAKPEAVTVSTSPTASSITLGQTLAASYLSGGSVVSASGTSVSGSWRWNSPNTKPTTTGKYEASFVPDDTSKYMSTTLKVSVTVADPCAKTHSYGSWKIRLAAACGQPGQQVRTCTVCGTQDTQAIAALEHNWQPSGVGYSVCTNCGDILNTGILVPDGKDGFTVIPNFGLPMRFT